MYDLDARLVHQTVDEMVLFLISQCLQAARIHESILTRNSFLGPNGVVEAFQNVRKSHCT